MDVRVKKVVDEELPNLQYCRQRKVNAIISEARRKVSAYKALLHSHRQALLERQGMDGVNEQLDEDSAPF